MSEISTKKIGLIITDNEFKIENLTQGSAQLYCPRILWMKLQKFLCNYLYPIPNKVKFIGVTGTNGKTSTVNFASQILNQKNINNVTIGTLGVAINGRKINDFSLTSPAYIDFRKIISANCKSDEIVIFEMSSHALDQERFYEIELSSAGWTSFTQDHLDYHQNMEKYFEAKSKIFSYLLKENAYLYVPNSQEELWSKLSKNPKAKRCFAWDKYSFKNDNELFKANFARDNFTVAYEVVKDLIKVEPSEISLKNIKTADGRWMLKFFEGKTIIIDYAHTPDALTNVCSNASDSFKNSKIKVLFGCGGDRDKTKRPLMGKAVSEFASYIYITSDNPRTEDPEKIINDIIPGISKPFYRNEDREFTLKKALEELSQGEVLIVAGKGHENYIIKGTTKHPYSDEQVCDAFINKKSKGI